MSAPVPQEWTEMIGHLAAAQVADGRRKDRAANQIDRDGATITYSRAVDGVFTCLSRLRETGELGRITLFLARRERR
jgi:hypothetical protein